MMSDSKRIIFLCVACIVPFFMIGCATGKKKDDGNITVKVEDTFRLRWIEKRGSELIDKGIAPSDARRQAVQEFRERYEFTTAAHE